MAHDPRPTTAVIPFQTTPASLELQREEEVPGIGGRITKQDIGAYLRSLDPRFERLRRMKELIDHIFKSEGKIFSWRHSTLLKSSAREEQEDLNRQIATLKEFGIEATSGPDALLKFEKFVATYCPQEPKAESPDEWRERQVRHVETMAKDEAAKRLAAVRVEIEFQRMVRIQIRAVEEADNLTEDEKRQEIAAWRAALNPTGGNNEPHQVPEVL
jgi:hypothetical protein